MKRNESILVYSVTGLLVVILAVAILFGNERGAQAAQPNVRGFDDLVGVAAAPEGAGGAADDRSPVVPITDTRGAVGTSGPGAGQGGVPDAAAVPAPGGAAQPSPDAAPPGQPQGQGSLGQGSLGQGSLGQAPLGQVPLSVPAQPTQPTPDPNDPALQALVLLGDSKREGDYRIVTVRHNDTFSELVQRWCGSLDQLEVAESLNEEVNLARLEPGSRVCLPWVDDATLVAAHTARKAKQEVNSKIVAEARTKGLEHVVKPGDSLWSIAVRQVGQKAAPKFIEQVKALNPDLLADPNRLVVGKSIILPK